MAKAAKTYFWPSATATTSVTSQSGTDVQDAITQHEVKKDASAFCFTFSVLLRFASREMIESRKEEVKEITSGMLENLFEDSTELVRDASKATDRQLWWAFLALMDLRSTYCEEAVDTLLVMRLGEVWSSVANRK